MALVLLFLLAGRAHAVEVPPQCSGPPLQQVEVGDPPSFAGFCFDAEGDNLTITITQEPQKGTAEVVAQGSPFASVRYSASEVGPDSLKFKASDGSADSNEVTVTTDNVPAVNDPPLCSGPPLQLRVEVGAPSFVGSCFDDEGGNLTITITQEPQNGTAEVVAQGTPFASVRYSASEVGPDSLKFKASDGSADSNEVTVTTDNVPAVNDPPQCFGLQQVPVEVGESGSGVPCIDPEGDNLTITITQQPAKGTLEIVDQGTPSPSLRYTATSVGPDSFSYKASDGSADSNQAATTTVNVDTKEPETTIDAGPAGTTGDATPTFEFSASETGSSFECSVDGGAFAPCSSPYTTPLLADGAHTFAVRAIDAAGHSDPTPAARSFTVSTGGGGGGSGTGGGGSGTLDPVASPVIAGGASAGSAKVAANGLALLKTIVECRGAGPSCSVRTTVTARLRSNTFGAARTKTVKLGGSKFTIAAGKAARVKIKLSRKGLRLLKRRKRISAKVRINVARAGESTARTVKVTLKAPRRS
jgi:uncharacterized protein YggU (UPF0235/DUF167 family)